MLLYRHHLEVSSTSLSTSPSFYYHYYYWLSWEIPRWRRYSKMETILEDREYTQKWKRYFKIPKMETILQDSDDTQRWSNIRTSASHRNEVALFSYIRNFFRGVNSTTNLVFKNTNSKKFLRRNSSSSNNCSSRPQKYKLFLHREVLHQSNIATILKYRFHLELSKSELNNFYVPLMQFNGKVQ